MPRRSPLMETSAGSSLYDMLAEPVPRGAAAGETRITATKETLDDDREDLSDDDVIVGSRSA